MSHMVIYRYADGKPGYQQVDDLPAAVAFVEKIRNEEGVENSRIYRMEQVSYRFEPYYQVRLESGELLGGPPPSPIAAAAALSAPLSTPVAPVAPSASTTLTPVAAVSGAAPTSGAPAASGTVLPTPTGSATISAPTAESAAQAASAAASAEASGEGNGVRRGLFR